MASLKKQPKKKKGAGLQEIRAAIRILNKAATALLMILLYIAGFIYALVKGMVDGGKSN